MQSRRRAFCKEILILHTFLTPLEYFLMQIKYKIQYVWQRNIFIMSSPGMKCRKWQVHGNLIRQPSHVCITKITVYKCKQKINNMFFRLSTYMQIHTPVAKLITLQAFHWIILQHLVTSNLYFYVAKTHNPSRSQRSVIIVAVGCLCYHIHCTLLSSFSFILPLASSSMARG